jgi:hypothetical protein
VWRFLYGRAGQPPVQNGGFQPGQTGFRNVGLSGDYGGTWLLPQLVGPAVAKQWYFTAERVLAEGEYVIKCQSLPKRARKQL